MTPPQEEKTIEERLAMLEGDVPPVSSGTKEAVKEALKEWLDEKFMLVGKWTVNGVLAAGLVALVYFILMQDGWRHE